MSIFPPQAPLRNRLVPSLLAKHHAGHHVEGGYAKSQPLLPGDQDVENIPADVLMRRA